MCEVSAVLDLATFVMVAYLVSRKFRRRGPPF